MKKTNGTILCSQSHKLAFICTQVTGELYGMTSCTFAATRPDEMRFVFCPWISGFSYHDSDSSFSEVSSLNMYFFFILIF